MAAALGYRFLDKNGNELQPVGGNLRNVEAIDTTDALDTSKVRIEIACDVTNPLTGSNGAARVYAAQKGAGPEAIEELEDGMIHFAEILKKHIGTDIREVEGAGAAGGMGAGGIAFLNAKLVSGIDLALQYSNAEKHITNADLVISGEGKIDGQTLNGKVLAGVARLCIKHKKPLIAFCGTLDLTSEQLKDSGITSVFSIVNSPMPLSEAYENAFELLSETSVNLGKLLLSLHPEGRA
jgi:glycerate kinase